eukprot:COSAG02_NODE_7751_length_2862_cov_3.193992_3_plen_87_part_00
MHSLFVCLLCATIMGIQDLANCLVTFPRSHKAGESLETTRTTGPMERAEQSKALSTTATWVVLTGTCLQPRTNRVKIQDCVFGIER